MAKKKSKKDRLQAVVEVIRIAVSDIENTISVIETKETYTQDQVFQLTDIQEAINRHQNGIDNAGSLLEDLQSEMDDWASGMEDSNLANSEKCENVRTAADTMQESVDEMQSVDWPDTEKCDLTPESLTTIKEEVEQIHDELDTIADNLESLEW